MKQLQDIVKTLQTTHVEGNTAVEVLDITADSRAVKSRQFIYCFRWCHCRWS